MSLPLSKMLDPADLDVLTEELALVDEHPVPHPMRRWEYALALRAVHTWQASSGRVLNFAYDVGGAGNHLKLIVGTEFQSYQVVDPADPDYPRALSSFLDVNPILADVVFCISVLEHIEDLEEFVYHLSCLVVPGGLLFLTVDACADLSFPPDDHYANAPVRHRIFNIPTLGALSAQFLRRDFTVFGALDYTWHGAHVADYTFASLAMVKRR